jgi:hypothetical protein
VNVARRTLWLLTGFASATALTAVLESNSAFAQSTQSSPTSITPVARSQAVPQRRNGLPPTVDAGEQAVIQSTAQRRSGAPGTVPDDTNPDAEASDGNEDGDDPLNPRQSQQQEGVGQRRAIRDGDLNAPEPDPVLDGVITTGEPRPALDGADPTALDNRPPEDIAVFEAPPAGFDAQLFQIEIDPILDRRPAQLFRFEPYEARGIRLGSFVLLPELEYGNAHFSNVFKGPNARSDLSLEIKPTARLVSNWRQHAVEFRATGALSYFAELDTENDKSYALEARGRYDITRRTNIEILTARAVTQDSRSNINAPTAAAARSDITTDVVALAFNHRFNRLGIQLRGSVTEADYAPVATVSGGTISNNDRDIRTTEEAVRASWEFKPTLFGFVEAGLNQRNYKSVALSDGLSRDSTGERYRVGVSFGNGGQRLRGEASVGYAVQRPSNGRLADIDGFIFDANLGYRMSALTSFLLTARSDIQESSLSGSGGALSRQLGIEARHSFRRNLIASAGLSYSVADFEGVSQIEKEARANLGAEYFLNREVTLFSRYQHTTFTSTDISRNYNADEIRVGMRIKR